MYNIDMTMLFVSLTAIMFLLLVISTAMKPIRAEVSQFELQRQKKQSTKTSQLTLERETMAPVVGALLALSSAVWLVVLAVTSVQFYGWVWGLLVVTLVLLTHKMLARFSAVQKVSKFLYLKIEKRLIKFTKKAEPVLSLMTAPADAETTVIHSKDELVHIVQNAKQVLSAAEISKIIHGLEFSDKTVKDIMVPRSEIETVDKNDLLGPATLDALYKTGHSRLPVIDDDIDQVIGVLYINNLLIATSKETPTAAETMRSPVCLVKQDQPLSQVLDLMINEHHDLALVVGKTNKTVGLISLGSVVRAATGQKD